MNSKENLINSWRRLQLEVYNTMTPRELNNAYVVWFGTEQESHRKDMVVELMESEEEHKLNYAVDDLKELVDDLKFHLDYD